MKYFIAINKESIKLLFILINIICKVSGLTAQDHYSDTIKAYREMIKADHLADERSPLNANDFDHIVYFNADRRYKIEAKFLPNPIRDTISIPTSSGKMKRFIRAGKIEFNWHSKTQQLTTYIGIRGTQSDHDYFIPFKDRTNGKQTYGGGRFLEIPIDSENEGTIEIDFNKAYNPWCAYSEGFNCPIPPVENELKIAIKAGEKMFRGEKKHESKILK